MPFYKSLYISLENHCAWYDFDECKHEWYDIKYDTCSYGIDLIFCVEVIRCCQINLCNFVLILMVIRSQRSAQWLQVVLLKELFWSSCFSTQHVNPVVGSRQLIWTDILPKPSFITSWILIIYIWPFKCLKANRAKWSVGSPRQCFGALRGVLDL